LHAEIGIALDALLFGWGSPAALLRCCCGAWDLLHETKESVLSG